jgi:hypothetical protein
MNANDVKDLKRKLEQIINLVTDNDRKIDEVISKQNELIEKQEELQLNQDALNAKVEQIVGDVETLSAAKNAPVPPASAASSATSAIANAALVAFIDKVSNSTSLKTALVKVIMTSTSQGFFITSNRTAMVQEIDKTGRADMKLGGEAVSGLEAAGLADIGSVTSLAVSISTMRTNIKKTGTLRLTRFVFNFVLISCSVSLSLDSRQLSFSSAAADILHAASLVDGEDIESLPDPTKVGVYPFKDSFVFQDILKASLIRGGWALDTSAAATVSVAAYVWLLISRVSLTSTVPVARGTWRLYFRIFS